MKADQTTYKTALGHYRNGQFEQALQALHPLLTQTPVDAEALNLAAICAIDLGRNEEAQAFLQRVVAANPKAAGIHVINLGNLLLDRRSLPEAELALRQAAARLHPDDPVVLCNLAGVLTATNQLEESEAFYR
ncbi:hypothetical protein BPMI_02033c [Candidatus Burkholderia pumila]|uniref:Tetratricopeptide repeat protein n=1 Tax=Candidatus Burkholderia pumila TaxID=1090375 RepID=A0ABR5HPF0_9BURK|nr:hypothetical protein BPMI_02033c [Candidatus Burkholderia pumila]